MPDLDSLNPRLLRLLEGRSRWGRLAVHPSRHGVTRYTLTLYPPGLDRAGRVGLRLLEAWPWLSVLLVAGDAVWDFRGQAIGAAGLAVLAWLLGRVALLRRTRRVREAVLVLHGIDGLGPMLAGRLLEIRAASRSLAAADAALESGSISPVDHELVWGRVYARAALQKRQQSWSR